MVFLLKPPFSYCKPRFFDDDDAPSQDSSTSLHATATSNGGDRTEVQPHVRHGEMDGCGLSWISLNLEPATVDVYFLTNKADFCRHILNS